jgi:plastocyanin
VRDVRFQFTVVIAVLSAVVAVLGAGPPVTRASAGTVQVDATNSGASDVFSPDLIDITVGDTVQWNFTGDNPHSVTSTSAEAFDSGAAPMFPGDPPFTHTFNSAGSFTYKCIVHATMTGTVNVQAPTATAVAPTETREATHTPRPTDTPDLETSTATSVEGTPSPGREAATPEATTAAVEGAGPDASPTAPVVERRQLPATGMGRDQAGATVVRVIALAVGSAALLGASLTVALRRRVHRLNRRRFSKS